MLNAPEPLLPCWLNLNEKEKLLPFQTFSSVCEATVQALPSLCSQRVASVWDYSTCNGRPNSDLCFVTLCSRSKPTQEHNGGTAIVNSREYFLSPPPLYSQCVADKPGNVLPWKPIHRGEKMRAIRWGLIQTAGLFSLKVLRRRKITLSPESVTTFSSG